MQAFSLQEQISHKVAYVMEHLSGTQAAPIVLIGHSIGMADIPSCGAVCVCSTLHPPGHCNSV